MTPTALKKLDRELNQFLDEMIAGMGRPERRSAMAHYITGLLLDGERKSVQPMAARLAVNASEADALRQRLQDCVSLSPWSDEEMLRRLALKLDREIPGIEAFVVDDTGMDLVVSRQLVFEGHRSSHLSVASSGSSSAP